MKLTIPVEDGDPIEFESEDSIASNWVNGDILRGKTYPFLPFVPDVRVILDVGANCGATSVYLARRYPEAEIHAFEPGTPQRMLLERNTAAHPNVRVHGIGLHASDQEAQLWRGEWSGVSSITKREFNLDEFEVVELRNGAAWAADHGIERVDVLKVDVEGCEIEVLEGLEPLLPTVKVLYAEYDSRNARRDLDRLLAATHEMFIGKMFLDQGECLYLRRDVADLDAATEWLRDAFVKSFAPTP